MGSYTLKIFQTNSKILWIISGSLYWADLGVKTPPTIFGDSG